MTEHAAPPMPQPTAEHKLLQDLVGNWKVACKFYMDPSQPPMETTGTEKVEKLGEFWAVARFETQMMGAPFAGLATTGYDPVAKQFVSTWIDSMMPVLCSLSGKQKGDTIEMRGSFYSCMTNSVLAHRTTEKRIGKNERIFEMFCTMPDGKEIKMMTNHYKRA